MNSAIFLPGQLLAQGRYRIERLLGEGGMGVVYEATELTLERKVALKVLLPELSQHPTARQRMEAEAKAMARLNSPHVVRVNTVFDEGGLLVIDLEFMGGGSLADRLDGSGVDEATARDWISQILKGLEALHKVGLVHRDLKPANVLLDEQGVLKVTDLGIAQDSQRTGGLKTRHDANLGTAEYMAPEQVQSAATVDARADVYAAGVMLYEFLTGRVPFSGEDWAVKAAQVKEEPDLGVVRAKSPALGAVVERALAKEADRRWPSAVEMHGALAAQPVVTGPVLAGKAPSETGKEATAAPTKPRSRLAWVIGVAVLTLGGGGLAAWAGVDNAVPAATASAEPGSAEAPAPADAAPGSQEPLAAPAAAPAPPPPPKLPAARDRLIGKWGIDLEKLGEIEEIRKMPEDQRKAAIEMAKGFATSMSFEFTKNRMIMDAMGKKVVGTYVVSKSEGEKLTIEATLEGKSEILQAEFKGNRLVLGKDSEKFTLKRK